MKIKQKGGANQIRAVTVTFQVLRRAPYSAPEPLKSNSRNHENPILKEMGAIKNKLIQVQFAPLNRESLPALYAQISSVSIKKLITF